MEDFFMKKIVSAVTLASLLAGAAFADISFSYTGKNYFSSDDQGPNSKAFGYDGDLRSDCIALSINQDNYGATLDVDIENNGMKIDEYYGWMTFKAISTTFTAGVWNSRYVDRVTTDMRGVSFDNQDFELFKPGVIDVWAYRDDTTDSVVARKKYNYNVAYDSDNLTRGALSMFAAYTNTALPGTLMVKLGLIDVTGLAADSKNAYWNGKKVANLSSEGAWQDNTNVLDPSFKVRSGFAGEVAYRQENLFAVNLAIRSYEVHTASVGLFFSPLMVDKLEATAGVTLGFNGAGYNGTRQQIYQDEGTLGFEWAIDLRARYAFSDRLSVTTMHNFSSYLTDLATDAGMTDTTKWEENDYAMWNQFNVTYDFAENLTAGFTVQHLATDLDQSYVLHNHIWVAPNLQIKVNDNAKFTVVTRAHFQNVGSSEDSSKWTKNCDQGYDHRNDHSAYQFALTIPVIFTFHY
jgi:hypothetical protein